MGPILLSRVLNFGPMDGLGGAKGITIFLMCVCVYFSGGKINGFHQILKGIHAVGQVLPDAHPEMIHA